MILLTLGIDFINFEYTYGTLSMEEIKNIFIETKKCFNNHKIFSLFVNSGSIFLPTLQIYMRNFVNRKNNNKLLENIFEENYECLKKIQLYLIVYISNIILKFYFDKDIQGYEKFLNNDYDFSK